MGSCEPQAMESSLGCG